VIPEQVISELFHGSTHNTFNTLAASTSSSKIAANAASVAVHLHCDVESTALVVSAGEGDCGGSGLDYVEIGKQ